MRAAESGVTTFRVFVSSPSDVKEERERTLRAVARLNGAFQDDFQLEPVVWENDTYSMRTGFQEQIANAAETDFVIGIVWARAGLRLDPGVAANVRDDGTVYESGTVFEIEHALQSLKRRGWPEVALFRKTAPPPDEMAERETQLATLAAVLQRWTMTATGEYRAALNTFATPDEFEHKVERHLRKCLAERGFATVGDAWHIGERGTPFPGLRPYDASFQRVFFGRSAAVRLCMAALRGASERRCAFLLVIGASGSGKSSLARAGLLPRIAVRGSFEGVEAWRIADVLPGATPLAALDAALRRAFTDDAPDRASTPHGNGLTAPPDAEAVAGAALGRLTENERLVLLLDQLEESFAHPGDGFERAVDALARSGKALVVATMRADHYARLQASPLLMALKRDGAAYDLAAPGRAEFEEIVRGPARAAGLVFERRTDAPSDLGDALLEAVGGSDALPLLQMTLELLFDARDRATGTLTFGAYAAIGGLEGAIGRRAGDVLATLDDAARGELPALLLALADVGPTGDYVAHPISRTAFEAANDARSTLVRALLDGRLLVVDRDDTLRVAHEALLRNWPVALDILATHELVLRVRAHLEPRAREWLAGGRQDDDLLPDARLLHDAESVLQALRESGSPDVLLGFVEASVRARDLARAQLQAQLALDEQKVANLIENDAFADAANELRRVVTTLRDRKDPALAERLARYDVRCERLRRLGTFRASARAVFSLAGEENFGKAPAVCRVALDALGVDDDTTWWQRLPVDDLAPAQVEAVKQEAYRTLLLASGLELVPGIVALFPRRQRASPKRRPLDGSALAPLVPGFVLAAVVRMGGLGPFRLPGRLDNGAARDAFRRSLRTLDQVRAVEAIRDGERGRPAQTSRTSELVQQIAEALLDVASGPKGAPIAFARWMRAARSRARREPVNAADYFFVGLFNYFIARRRDGLLAKALGLVRGRFPDLDLRRPYETAERFLRAGIALEPVNFWPHWVLGRTLLSRGDGAAAELAFNAAVALEPTYARGYEQRALALAHQWRHGRDPSVRARAESDSARALAVANGDPSIFWPRGELFEALDRTGDALDAYARWLELEEDIPATISRVTGLTRLDGLTGDLLRARRATRSEPAVGAAALAVRALVHTVWGDFGQADVAARAALALDPNNPHALVALGLAHAGDGAPDAAADAFDRALAADPFGHRAAFELARLRDRTATGGDARRAAWNDLVRRSEAAANAGRERCPPWMLAEAGKHEETPAR